MQTTWRGGWKCDCLGHLTDPGHLNGVSWRTGRVLDGHRSWQHIRIECPTAHSKFARHHLSSNVPRMKCSSFFRIVKLLTSTHTDTDVVTTVTHMQIGQNRATMSGCNKSDLITCKWHSRQSVLKIRSENSSAGSAVWTRRNSRTDHGREGNTEWFPNLAPFHVFMCYTNLLFFLCQHKRMLDGEKWSLIIESKIFWQLCDKQNETEVQMRQWTQRCDRSPLWRTGSRLQSRAAGVAARGPHTAQTASPTCCTASQRQTALLHRDKQLVSGFFMLDSKRHFLLLSPHRAQLDSASEPCNK